MVANKRNPYLLCALLLYENMARLPPTLSSIIAQGITPQEAIGVLKDEVAAYRLYILSGLDEDAKQAFYTAEANKEAGKGLRLRVIFY